MSMHAGYDAAGIDEMIVRGVVLEAPVFVPTLMTAYSASCQISENQ